MATWPGWAGELLGILNCPDSREDERFLNEWAKAQPTTCENNPLQAHTDWRGATACGETSKNYPTQTAGLQATAKQLNEAAFAALLAALRSGNPFAIGHATAVSSALDTWGATTYAPQYRNETSPSGGGGGIKAPRTLGAWSQLRHSVNHDLPDTLKRSQRNTHRALQALSRARRVRL